MTYLALALGILTVGALLSAVSYTNDRLAHLLGSWSAILGSLVGLLAALSFLLQGDHIQYVMPTFSLILDVVIRIEPLGALFLLLTSGLGLLASIYGLSYMSHYIGRYNLGRFGFFYNLFLASLFLVVTAGQSVWFLLVWELMSLTSFFLVIYEYREARNLKAGYLYFTMTHLATLLLTVAFLLLYRQGGLLYFNDIAAAVLPNWLKNSVFLLCLIGFGTKAGMVPLHVWLPKAHPAAPSQVSAMMSGVMIKTGILMLILVSWELMSSGPLWWGALVLILGAVSSLLGVLWALTEHDIKRLLAYHSVENIGIILMGLGAALSFRSLNLPVLANLALAAALFHTINHAVFKGLLFLGAGSVVSATGTRNIEEYGGLLKRMPYTGLFFLVGAMAISALPPLNGFASEWQTYKVLFAGLVGHGFEVSAVFAAAIAALAFTGGLAAACFVKAFGVTFLARPRSQESQEAKECAGSMSVPMGVLAVACLGLGLTAAPIMRWLQGVIGVMNAPTTIISLDQPSLFIALVTAVALTILWTVSRSPLKTEVNKTWNCGTPLTPRMEMSATGFSRSIITVFRGVLKPSIQVKEGFIAPHNQYFPVSHVVAMETRDVCERYGYIPGYQGLLKLAARINKMIHHGNLNAYILYITLTLIGICIWAVL